MADQTILMVTPQNSPSSLSLARDPLSLLCFRVDDAKLKAIKRPSLKQFYEQQNTLIDLFVGKKETVVDDYRLNVAIYASLGANIALFGLQLTAAIFSKSIALFATTADAFMDLASTAVMLYSSRLAKQENTLLYPTGKTRYTTMGVIVFATLMSTISLQIIITSIQSFAARDHEFNLPTISIVCVSIALITKMILYMYCRALSEFPMAGVLAQDHINDVIFNSTGLFFVLLSSYTFWWIDPAAGILIALLIFRSWTITGREQAELLIGKTADSQILNHLTYIAMTHDPRILQVDTCKAYHSGNNLFVEIDIVLPPNMMLCEAHDIGESLQMEYECLPNVDRAFVHIDYETEHQPEHKKKK